MNEQNNAEILSLLDPISVSEPAGNEIEYELIYERIRQAREHDEEVIAEGEWACEARVADWAQVISLSCEVLTQHSKHFQVACWLTEGWVKKQQLAGLEKGIELLNGMLQLWWHNGFPTLEEDGESFSTGNFWAF